MSNFYNSKYGLYDCYKCLCEVCTRIDCPKMTMHHNKLQHCLIMRQRGCCPTIKCDFFTHQEKRKILKVRRRYQKQDAIIEKLNEIMERLDKLGGGDVK